jgi:hypothetical protein
MIYPIQLVFVSERKRRERDNVVNPGAEACLNFRTLMGMEKEEKKTGSFTSLRTNQRLL